MAEKKKTESRKDNKGRKLNDGECQRPDGIYVYRWTANKKRNAIYAGTLQELREKEKEIKRDVIDGIDVNAGNITLNKLIMLNLELRKLKPSTVSNYKRMWENNIKNSRIGNTKIRDIIQIDIKQFYKELMAKPLKKNSIKLIHNIIFSSFEMAINNDMIRKNPAKECMDIVEADAIEKTPLTQEQANNLIEFCKNHACYNVHVPFLTIALKTGLRCGEITGLRWQDVDLKNNTISVNHQLCYKNVDGTGCKFYITTPKTDAGNRVIPMTDAVHKAFTELKKLNLMLGKSSQMVVDGYSGFCFLSANGSPLATNAVNSFLYGVEKAYNKAHSDAPIPHLSAHILRHSACTIYSSAGMDVKSLQYLMGHSDANITMNVYDHGSLERTEKALQRLNNVVNI